MKSLRRNARLRGQPNFLTIIPENIIHLHNPPLLFVTEDADEIVLEWRLRDGRRVVISIDEDPEYGYTYKHMGLKKYVPGKELGKYSSFPGDIEIYLSRPDV